MCVRTHFQNIDEVTATIKAATIKNRDCKRNFYDADLPSPPDPVITKWATWLRAALYITVIAFHLVVPLSIIELVQASLVSLAKDAINVEDLVPDLVKINQYRTLAANV